MDFALKNVLFMRNTERMFKKKGVCLSFIIILKLFTNGFDRILKFVEVKSIQSNFHLVSISVQLSFSVSKLLYK